MVPAFELHDVTVIRSGATLLDGVSWRVGRGEQWVVLGPNGAGKSTLMQVVGAQIHPTSGTAEVLDEVIGETNLPELRTHIGHTAMSVAERIPAAETVHDTVISAAYAVVGRWTENYDPVDEARAAQIMGELGIAALAGRTFGTLSEGERKRTLIARALMADPELLILDEPAGGLDLGAREDLISSLDTLATADDAPVLILVSHHVEEIPPGFTHVLMLAAGRVVVAGPIAEVLTAGNLGRTFNTKLDLSRTDGRYSARRADYGRRRALPLPSKPRWPFSR